MTTVLYMYVFILLKYIAYIAKGIKTLKIMKNNGTTVKGLKMFTLRHASLSLSLRSESEAQSCIPTYQSDGLQLPSIGSCLLLLVSVAGQKTKSTT